jgi:hypothetical protein
MSLPLSSNPINPRSKRWSILGVKSKPFSPSSRSSLVSPRFAVTCYEVRGIFHASDATSCFNLADPVLADSDEGGQLFRLKADSVSDRLRTPFR